MGDGLAAIEPIVIGDGLKGHPAALSWR